MKDRITRLLRGDEGQASVEYAMITAAIMGGVVMSWPFLIRMIEAMNIYYQSLYWVIQSPIP